MDKALIEKQNVDNIKKIISMKRKYTVNSIDSSPEFQHKTYLSKTILLMSFLSLIIGLYILFNQSYYLNKDYNFSNLKTLYYYIIIYTLGLFGVIIISFCLALIIKLMSSIKKCLKSNTIDNEKENILISEEEDDDNFLSQILENANNISMIPYTFSICVLFTIILYLTGFPLSWYLIYSLMKNNIYYNVFNFFLLYCFIFINTISGSIFIFVLVIFIKTRRQNSLRKLSFIYDDYNLEAVYKEVKDAIDLVK